jgi:PAS domain S-box-containing protein
MTFTPTSELALLSHEQLIHRLQQTQLQNQQLQSFLNHAPLLCAYVDTDYRYQYANQGYQDIFGAISPGAAMQQILGESWFASSIPVLMQAMAGETIKTECQYLLNTAKTNCTSAVLYPDKSPDGSVKGIFIVVTDHSWRAQLERSLQESVMLLKLFIDKAPAALAMLDRDLRYIAVSQRWLTDYGLQGQQLIGRCHYDVFPDIPEKWKADHRRGLAGEVLKSAEDNFVRGSGDELWLQWEIHPWYHQNDGELPGGVVFFSEDITARKKVEFALRESEQKYRLLIDQTPDGIFVADQQGNYVDVNTAGADMLGYTKDEIIGKNIVDIIHPQEINRLEEEISKFANGQIVLSEWLFRRKDNTTFFGEVVGRRLPDGRLQGLLRDITLRKSQEFALKQSEMFYRQTLESIPGMVFTTRPDGYCDFQSQQWVDYTGVPMHEHLGDGWNLLLHPDDRERAYQAWINAVEGLSSYNLEYRVRRFDNVYEWFRVIARPIFDSRNQIVRWFGVAINIEQLKNTERRLEIRNSELEALFDIIPAMVYVKDAEQRYIRVNQAFAEYLSLEPKHIIGKLNSEILPDDLVAIANQSDHLVLTEKQSFCDVEQSWTDQHQQTRWLMASKTPVVANDGTISGLVGIKLDITDRKNAETFRINALERQRDSLVREVHHRIKNHLQGVTGLLRNSLRQNDLLRPYLQKSIDQIQTIAQVYGLQSSSHDTQMRLCDLLRSTSSNNCDANIQVECELPAHSCTHLSQDEAVPIALILNELITNAKKHVTPNGPPQPIKIRLVLNGEKQQALITIRSGPAQLPMGLNLQTHEGIGTGLELVLALMPHKNAELQLREDGDDVVASLLLQPPVVSKIQNCCDR